MELFELFKKDYAELATLLSLMCHELAHQRYNFASIRKVNVKDGGKYVVCSYCIRMSGS